MVSGNRCAALILTKQRTVEVSPGRFRDEATLDGGFDAMDSGNSTPKTLLSIMERARSLVDTSVSAGSGRSGRRSGRTKRLELGG